MADQQLLLRTLAEFARTLVHPYDVDEVLFDLSDRITRVLELAGAGVSLSDDGTTLRFASSTDAAVDSLERHQEQHQVGPCIDAFRSDAPTLVPDLTRDVPWPAFASDAEAAGLIAVAGIPMGISGTRIGALNLYDTAVREWTPDDVEVARLFADMAATFIISSSELLKAERTREQLEQALANRAVIEQAKGILAVHHHTSVDVAFERLRRHARDHRATLRSVADAVVQLGLRP